MNAISSPEFSQWNCVSSVIDDLRKWWNTSKWEKRSGNEKRFLFGNITFALTFKSKLCRLNENCTFIFFLFFFSSLVCWEKRKNEEENFSTEKLKRMRRRKVVHKPKIKKKWEEKKMHSHFCGSPFSNYFTWAII